MERPVLTMAEWAARQSYAVHKHPSGARCIHDGVAIVDRSEAFRLSDWVVSSIAGGTIWFVPRRARAE